MTTSSNKPTKRAPIKRARSRGLTTLPTVMEAAMCIATTVTLVVGEMAMTRTVDARRSVEDGADESATKSGANYCSPESGSSNPLAQMMPSVSFGGVPQVQAAISALAGMGVGSERTYPNYLLPLQNIRVTGNRQEAIRIGRPDKKDQFQFSAERGHGCLEKPLDTPMGSIDQYRMKMWVTNLQGY